MSFLSVLASPCPACPLSPCSCLPLSYLSGHIVVCLNEAHMSCHICLSLSCLSLSCLSPVPLLLSLSLSYLSGYIVVCLNEAYMSCHICLSLPVFVLPVPCPLAPVSLSPTWPATLWSVSMRRTCHVISAYPCKSLSCLSSVPLLLSPSVLPVRPHCGLSQ
jgi:hypothetical protein